MNLYLQRLMNERDSLTRSATSITDTAAREERDVTDTEAASIASMATRCAEIDSQVAVYQQQHDSAKAYASLRSAVLKADEDDDHTAAPLATRTGGGEVETRDGGGELDPFVAQFEERAATVFDNYSGRGKSGIVEVGSVLDERAVITTADFGTAGEKTRRVPTPPAWSSPFLSLINTVPVSTGVVEWLRFAPNPAGEATEVPEGQLKPESTFSMTLNEDKLKTFAHWKGITRQALDDMSALRGILETRLRTGLQRKLATEAANVLSADATIPTLDAATLLAGIRVAMGTFDDESGYAATGVALNPIDWAQLDIDSLGQTLQGPVRNTGAWGLRFASSSRIPVGTAYVGDFGQAVTLFDRRVTAVYTTDAHADFFLRNQLVILAETRALVVVEEPLALIKVNVIGDSAAPRVSADAEGSTVTATATPPAKK